MPEWYGSFHFYSMTTESIHNTPESEIRMATVYLRAATGKSLVTGKPTAASIQSFQPTPETVRHAKQALADLGFTIESEGVTLSISGPQSLFEKHCAIKILPVKNILEIKKLDRYIEGIEFAIPGVPFNGCSR